MAVTRSAIRNMACLLGWLLSIKAWSQLTDGEVTQWQQLCCR